MNMQIKIIILAFVTLVSASTLMSQTYSYDAAGRIVSARYAGGKQITYEYDGRGNVTKRTTATVNSVNDIDNTTQSISLSPNPTASNVMVQLGSVVSGNNARLIVTDVAGRTVAEQAMVSGQQTVVINVAGLAQGSYAVALVDGTTMRRSPLLIVR